MKIPLNKLRANMGWYTSTARGPAPKIWRQRKKAAAHIRAAPLVPRKRMRVLRKRARRRVARRTSAFATLAYWTVLAIGAVVLLRLLLRLIFAMLELDMPTVADQLADFLRSAR